LNTKPTRMLFAHLSRLLLYTPLGLFAACSAHAMQKVEERVDLTLPDIAAVHIEAGQAPIILYNPLLCQHAGRDLCAFYRYHEYGHLELQHHKRNNISIQQKEREADEWAARHAPLRVVIAAYRHFMKGGGSSPVHGDSRVRAARLLIRSDNLLLSSGPTSPYRMQQQFARAF
jgi:hypothetical protein